MGRVQHRRVSRRTPRDDPRVADGMVVDNITTDAGKKIKKLNDDQQWE